MRPICTSIAVFAGLSVLGCSATPAIVENRSDTSVEVTVWALDSGLSWDTDVTYRHVIGAGERFEFGHSDRAKQAEGRPAPSNVRVHAIPNDTGIGRTWLLSLEQRAPLRLRIHGTDGDLRFESLREDGVVRSSRYLTVREDAALSDGVESPARAK